VQIDFMGHAEMNNYGNHLWRAAITN
jgi:hypothetical protein